MFILKYICVFCAAITLVHCILDDKVKDNTKNVSMTTNLNNYAYKKMNRRAVLIIDSDNALRNRDSKRKNVESLRYEEYDEDGKKLNEFMMYNLEDVSRFFKAYLGTEICHVKCEE
ncbi:uncharacterized protein LOC115442523 [Manduca sexta]|uniref:Fam-c protein n=1 Tax=Manduca sexta TaxID=7130 RepID=A0A921Z1I5_MANSE|nr:uncharacterized protein LOC115442523 [Manduca sexta]KAG6448614.1 hypothetical protein O3G_MSEX005587 [Manduca sexta]